MQDEFVFAHRSNLFLSVSPSISGSEQHKILCIQNSNEAATGSEGSETYVQYFIDAIF